MSQMVYFLLGVIAAIGWRFIFERGHCVFGVASPYVQEVLRCIVCQYAGLRFLSRIKSGPTNQLVLSGGTVFCWFATQMSGPKNVRSLVVWGKRRRLRAAQSLFLNLREAGFGVKISEPLPFPAGIFLLVTSDAFLDCAIALRPHWLKMIWLSQQRAR